MATYTKELSFNADITMKLGFPPAHSQPYLCCKCFEAEDSDFWTLVNVVASQTQHELLSETARQIIKYLSYRLCLYLLQMNLSKLDLAAYS